MSTRPKKPRAAPARKSEATEEEGMEKAEKPERRTRVEERKPKGATPRAVVSARKGKIMITRDGRGFSFGELEGAAFPLRFTQMWRVPVDLRRRSVLSANVNALKKWYVPAPKAPAPKVPKEAGKPKAPKEQKEQKGPKAKARKEAPKKRAPSKKPKS